MFEIILMMIQANLDNKKFKTSADKVKICLTKINKWNKLVVKKKNQQDKCLC